MLSDDLLAGVIFAGTGIGAVVLAADYGIGTAAQMGAGYIPAAVGGLLIIIGAGLILRALLKPAGSQQIGFTEFRPLVFVMGAVVAFGALVNTAGLIVAMIVLSGVAGFADRRSTWLGVASTATVMIAVLVLIFAYGLRMNIPLGW